jgi:hypothetical protein
MWESGGNLRRRRMSVGARGNLQAYTFIQPNLI